jgi:hypothetical protein
MSHALSISVKESMATLKLLYRKTSPFLQPRLKLLMVLKKHDGQAVSKRAIMEQTGLCSYSVHKWRTLYYNGGIDGLLSHNKKGFKPKLISKDQHIKLKSKLATPENGLRGYKELQEWINKEFRLDLPYVTVYKYCKREFGTKIKVARKYHAQKDEEAVALFKKTSVKNAKKPLETKEKTSNR